MGLGVCVHARVWWGEVGVVACVQAHFCECTERKRRKEEVGSDGCAHARDVCYS